MKYAVCYSSATGNTRMIAEAIYKALPPEKELFDIAELGHTPLCDRLFVGFWIDKGACDATAKAFLGSLSGARVALFGTMGAKSDGAYGEGLLTRAAALLPEGCKFLGGFLCQGKLDPSAKKRYEEMARLHPDNLHIAAQLENFTFALTHPDPHDFANAEAFARQIASL